MFFLIVISWCAGRFATRRTQTMHHVVDQLRSQMGHASTAQIGVCVIAILAFVFFAEDSAAQSSSLTVQTTNQKSLIKSGNSSQTSTEGKNVQTAKAVPHRLIRKPQSPLAATLQPTPFDASKPITSTAGSTSPPNNATAQSQDTSLSSKTAPLASPTTVPTALMPSAATTTITTATPNTIAPRSSSTGTTTFAGATTAAGSTNGSNGATVPTGGRSMSNLAAEMPGLSQLVTPSSSSAPSSPPAPVPPAIGASPTSLSFTAQQGSGNPAVQTLSISNTGGGTLSWSASDNAAWLTVSPASGTGNGSVAVSAALGTLAAGSYSATVTLSATGATPVTVPVAFTVTAAPTISLSPISLSYAATQGAANPSNQTVTVTNSGGTLTWAATDNASWLALTPSSGSGNGTLTASVNTAGLAAGTYNGTITVAASGATSQQVGVVLTVNSPSTSSATLTWNASTSSNVSGYKVYRATASGAYGAPTATLQGSVTTYVSTGLQSGTTYFFVVTAFDASGTESSFSNEVSKSIF